MFATQAKNGFGAAAILALLLAFLTASPAFATISIPELPKDKKRSKKEMVVVPPPQAVPVTVEATNGGTVQIPLRVFGKQEQNTTYIIRKGPELGKIVSVTAVEAEVSVLTYQHTSVMRGEAKVQDKILYVAQNKNGTSASAEILITIADIPPELDAPNSVEFGEIAAGQTATRAVTISNRGGGMLEGTVTLESPWKVTPSAFMLRQGEKALLQVTLTPDAEREYQGHMRFLVGETQFQPTVHATVFSPFTAGPAEQRLKIATDLTRNGAVTLLNRTPSLLKVRVEANERLRLPAEITLPPGKPEAIHVSLESDNIEGIETAIRFICGSVEKQVKISAPRLLVPKPSPSPTPTWQGASTPTPAPTALAATPAPTAPPLAQAQEPEAAPLPSEPPHPTTPVSLVDLQTAEGDVVGIPGEGTYRLLNNARITQLSSKGIVEFTWSAPQSQLANLIDHYEVQVRRVEIDDRKQTTQKWITIPDARFLTRGQQITALLADVPVNRPYTIHVIGVDNTIKTVAASTPVSFTIPEPQPLFTVRRILIAFFIVVLAGTLLYRRHQKLISTPGRSAS